MTYTEQQRARWNRASPTERQAIEAEWREIERSEIVRLQALLPGWHVGFAEPEFGADRDYAEEAEAQGVSVAELIRFT